MKDKQEEADILLYGTTKLYTMFPANFKTLDVVCFLRKLENKIIAEKEKWTNKWSDEREEAHSLIHITTSHAQCLY